MVETGKLVDARDLRVAWRQVETHPVELRRMPAVAPASESDEQEWVAPHPVGPRRGAPQSPDLKRQRQRASRAGRDLSPDGRQFGGSMSCSCGLGAYQRVAYRAQEMRHAEVITNCMHADWMDEMSSVAEPSKQILDVLWGCPNIAATTDE